MSYERFYCERTDEQTHVQISNFLKSWWSQKISLFRKAVLQKLQSQKWGTEFSFSWLSLNQKQVFYSISGRLARQKEILSATRSYGQKNELMRDNLPLSENMFPGPEFPSVFNNIIEMKSPLRNSHQQSYRKKEILQIQKLIFNLYI